MKNIKTMYLRKLSLRVMLVLSALGCVFGPSVFLLGQDESSESVRQVDFDKDVKPIIAKSCLKCHGTDEQEGGIDFEDVSTLEEFIEPGKRGESTLFNVITSNDEDAVMPPPDSVADGDVESLTKPEIALLALWIDEGANFGEQPKSPEKAPEHIAMRIWRFLGWFHPAVVHFPIAFFLLGAVFVVVFRRNMALANEASYYCLALGALAALFAVAFGWSLGFEKSQEEITDINGKLFWHRWSGVAVAVLAVIVWFLAWRQRSEEYSDGGGSWKLGLILLAAIVGIVGHQGGELVYGENLYHKKLERYLPEFYSSKRDAAEEDTLSTKSEEEGDQAVKEKAADEADNSKTDQGKSVDAAKSEKADSKMEQSQAGGAESKSADDPVEPAENSKLIIANRCIVIVDSTVWVIKQLL